MEVLAKKQAAAPWGVQVTVEREGSGEPFQAHTGGPGYAALGAAIDPSEIARMAEALFLRTYTG
jgi:hypothetical protein